MTVPAETSQPPSLRNRDPMREASERQTGLRGALRVEQNVGLSAAHFLHAAHVHLRVVTVNPETCNANTFRVANHAQKRGASTLNSQLSDFKY